MTKTKANSENAENVLNQLVLNYLSERKRKQKWRWVMRGILLILVLWVLISTLMSHQREIAAKSGPHVGLIDIKGQILDTQMASAENIIESINNAYESKGLKALLFRIDSPGGSPVQADYVYNAIQYQKEKHPEIKTYAVCVDMCASAAYYIAAAMDEIYADPSSMVGSIGVIYNGFGFVDTLQKLGVSRRLKTAGVHKGFLDQFSPESPEDSAYLQRMLDVVHEQFIAKVKAGRGSRLKIDDEVFSGLFWTGLQAKERGLIDGFGSSKEVARNIVGVEELVDYTTQETVFDLFAKNVGASVVAKLPEALGLSAGLR